MRSHEGHSVAEIRRGINFVTLSGSLASFFRAASADGALVSTPMVTVKIVKIGVKNPMISTDLRNPLSRQFDPGEPRPPARCPQQRIPRRLLVA